MSQWRPGQLRQQLAMETPYEGVPPHLRSALLHFVEAECKKPVTLFMLIIQRRLQGYPDPRRGNQEFVTALGILLTEATQDAILLLDLVELLLEYGPDSREVYGLKVALEMGNSAYKVRDDSHGLEMRITPGAREAVEEAIVLSAASSAGEHLTKAWNAAYGRITDPVRSYSEAIKAVEAAAAPVISPNNLRATLGTMRGELKAKLSAWTFIISPSAPGSMDMVLNMISTLWEGQTSRHGGVRPTVAETPEQARAAVHLAASLVQWFASGAVQKVQGGSV